MKIVWAKSALNALLTTYEYIYERSPKTLTIFFMKLHKKQINCLVCQSGTNQIGIRGIIPVPTGHLSTRA